LTEFYGSPGNQHEPRSLGERADRILEMTANPSALGSVPSPGEEYEARIRGLGQAAPPIRSLGDEMVMLGASLALPAARALPYAVRFGSRGIASIRALNGEAEQAANAVVQSFRNRLGRHPHLQELMQALGLAPDVGVNRAGGLGNPFHGRTPGQVDQMFRHKGFEARGDNPAGGIGGYINPETSPSYHIKPRVSVYREETEYPHVDVNRIRHSPGLARLKKRKFPLGDRLYGD
jgi:hypothetical protein